MLLCSNNGFAKEKVTKYTKENISNYFLGIVSSNNDYNDKAFKYLKKAKSIQNKHSRFNTEYIRTLVLVDKFDEAIKFSKDAWKEEDLFFEIDLLLGLDYFLKKDYLNAEKHFDRLNTLSRHNLVFDNFVGNVLISWIRASQGKKEESFKFINKIPKPYRHLKSTQDIFLKCYFNNNEVSVSLKKLTESDEHNFSRYNFFLINYLLYKNEISEAKIIIEDSRKKHDSNLLLKETEFLLLKNENQKIKSFFNCKKPTDSIAEFFYVIANLYSSEKAYRLSNFYLKISLFLNKNFLSNKALLAENFHNQKKYNLAKNLYTSLQTIGPAYSWHASKNNALINLEKDGKKSSINKLKKKFKAIKNPNFENYYELANFYKDYDYYEESIKYYTIALNKISNDHFLVSKILDRRGTSFERIGDWKNAEKDLIKSLKILPNQPNVLNYLGYSWIDMGINLDKGLEMIKKAMKLKENDAYITDSLGWAYYAKKKYNKAEFYLQDAVKLLPQDPVINDHYADSLWMLNKNIQARYIWNHVLSLESADLELKNQINKKLIFGIKKINN